MSTINKTIAVEGADLYHDDKFWRKDPDTGEESVVEYVQTPEEQIHFLQEENATLRQQATKLALCEVYELR